jgi:flavin reductase (DIM6/NTAB) family NADH-FMN oxidoreductase RutF
MKKINVGKRAFVYPMPMCLVGVMVHSRPNFMPAAWVTPVNYNPPMIAVALGKMHYTNIGIKEQKKFSICIPNSAIAEKVDYCGLVSGEKVDKSGMFKVYYEGDNTIPLIDECPVNIQVELDRVVGLPSNEMFIGQVINTFVDENCMEAGIPDIRKIDSYTLTMPDNRYWTVGENMGKAWNMGKTMK